MTRLLLPVVVFAAAVFAQLPSPSVALGHGQGTEIFRERQGRYELGPDLPRRAGYQYSTQCESLAEERR